METAGPGGGAPPPVPEKKKLNRAPSPARPKDLTGWSLSKARRPSPVALTVIPPGPRRPLPSPGTKKQAPPTARNGGKSKGQSTAGTRRGTDSSSEGSCASEENSSSTRGSSEEGGVSAASSRLPLSTSLAFSDLTEDLLDGGTESLLREMDELRSENDYLKDEIEELRSEMLEMRDVYMEEDVYQLQELRQQLEQVHKTCRILQYRLKKAERRGLRVAQTGQVDSELVSTLEQDVKVAKDVSVRLHNELEAVEKKRIKLEEENEELRQRLIETDLAKQVLQNEMDKVKENSLKRRRSGKLEKKPSPQEDNADLKCQLHFAKEESALMCKKLSKLAKENDTMKDELVKYRSMYGDLDSSVSIEELANSPHSREAEVKSHLKLVEEEANILSRRIVELEVENRGLRAEMDEMKVHVEREHLGQDSRFAFPAGDSGDNFVELRRHLQFVEEEADLLRRSMMELEDQNKLLMNELNKYKSDHDLDITLSEDSCSVISEPSQEELTSAKMQIGELSGKVKKLQYENRVLLSNLQRYDLASCQTTKPLMETDAEAGDSAQCVPTSLWREGPIGGETDSTDSKERPVKGILKSPDVCNNSPSRLPKIKDLESLFGIKAQVEIICKAIEVLTSDANGFPSGIKLCTDNDCGDLLLTEAFDNSEVTSNSKLVTAILSRLVGLQQELNCFTKKVDAFGESCKGQADTLSLLSDTTCPGTSKDSSRKENCSSLQLESGKLGADRASPDIKAALKREREDHQHLLAESYSAVMDLTKQLQVSEKNWAQEKEEMLARFQEERKQTGEQIKEMQNKLKQKEEESWMRRGSERKSGCWKEALNDKMQDKDIDCDIDASGTNLKRTKSVSSMSEFESLLDCSPFLPGQTPLDNTGNEKGIKGFLASQLLTNGSIDSDITEKLCPYTNDKTLSDHLAKDNLGISSWDYTLNKSGKSGEPGHKQIQRSYTAPDRTGIRIYYSPPVVRRLEAALVQNKEEKLMVEPGFLFTMAKPKDSEKSERLSGSSYSRWWCNFSKKKRDLLDKDAVEQTKSPVPAFPPSLGDLEISGNMSDDMKEITNCVRQAIRSSSLERKSKSTSSQTVGLSTVGVQTIQRVSVGLQTDLPRTSLHAKSWSPRSSSLLSTRTKHISTSLDKVHSRIERPCCSPKFGSPKLQRRSSSKLDASKDRSLWNLHQNKQNGSAWARSTTTRDSPVLTNHYDGSSSVFNVVDHAGSTESLYKAGTGERNKAEAPKYGIVQEFFRNVCGRSGPSSSTGSEKKELEENHKRTDNHDHCSSAVCHPSYNVSKLLNKKTPRPHVPEEHKSSLTSQGAKDGSSKDPDIISTTATEDYSCNCNSHPVTSCFSRPSRIHSRQTQSRCQLHQEPAPSEDKSGPGCN
ncbi:hypothetical protein GDO81_012973 [Engystomops pustulosus]|uniref:Protein SOGA1 n=1 Tax=Engystomops pustulosus TaxID=76066 RepID=A0AAV7AX84_ENGPU|nr:hypothetical protein GDO81_012973 [Engystomops pustulosus]